MFKVVAPKTLVDKIDNLGFIPDDVIVNFVLKVWVWDGVEADCLEKGAEELHGKFVEISNGTIFSHSDYRIPAQIEDEMAKELKVELYPVWSK